MSPTVRKGRKDGSSRPEIFKTRWAEFGFLFSIILSQIMSEYFVSGFFISLPTIVRALNIPEASSTWAASAFALTTGAGLLIFGRLADMYGAQRVYLLGMAWYTLWTLVCGFAVNEIMLDVARAMQGFGPAAFLTSGVALLGSVYKPGKRKNVVFAIYGGTAPIGFFFGIILGGVSSENLTWRWYFWIGTILSGLAFVGGLLTVPWNFDPRPQKEEDYSSGEEDERKGPQKKPEMDVWGACLFFVGLFLITFSLTDSPHAPQGWMTPYIPSLFVVGWLVLAVCIWYEAKVARHPLLPLRILRMPQMAPFMLGQFLTFGTFGIWLFYATLYLQNVMLVSPLRVVACFVPFGVGGLVISVLSGLYLHRVPGFVLLLLAATAWCVTSLLYALAPAGAGYWPWIFPSMITATLGIDVSYLVASVFLTSSLDENEQGLAGALFNSLQFLGISTFLGFADIAVTHYQDRGRRESYQTAFWLAMGCAVATLIIDILFVRMDRAKAVEDLKDEPAGAGTYGSDEENKC